VSTSASTLISRVLVIEDEPMLRSAVVAGLSRLKGIEVVGVGTVTAALAEISLRPPAVVISDIDLPDRSGIELLGELGARGLKPHVVFVSAYVKAYRPQIPPNAGVDVLEKPVGLDALRALVQQRVQATTEASPFGVADYLQLATLGHHSVVIEIAGATSGTITVVAGEAWSAEDALGVGMAAFRRLAMATGTLVRCQTLTVEPGPRSLTGNPESLLLECARLADEGGRDDAFAELSLEEAPVIPIPTASAPRPTLAPAPAMDPEVEFEHWFEVAVEALLAKKSSEALDAFRRAAALRPDDAKTQINVAKLEKLLAARE
jgi:DNA-binding response OmpR family regulator